MNNWFALGRRCGKSDTILLKLYEEVGVEMIYTYKCKRGHVFEKEMAVSSLATAKVSCPKCLTKKVFRIITSAPQVQFKGSGFFINDSKGK